MYQLKKIQFILISISLNKEQHTYTATSPLPAASEFAVASPAAAAGADESHAMGLYDVEVPWPVVELAAEGAVSDISPGAGLEATLKAAAAAA